MSGTGIDVKLRRSELNPNVVDIQLDANGDIATEDSFDTAIYVSLFTDARALDSQIARPERRRGWIGNLRTPGFQMGSVLWLFEMERLTRIVANKIEDAATAALRWMVDEGYAVSVKSKATILDSERLALEISITKPGGAAPEARLFELWENTGQTFLEAV